MDFIFGTLSTDALKLVHHRAAHRGVHHAHQREPRDPQPGQPVTVWVYTGVDFPASQVVCDFTTDGSAPRGDQHRVTHGSRIPLSPVETVWDTQSWGYVTLWSGELPGQDDGCIVRYRIRAWGEGLPERSADAPNPQMIAEQAAAAFFRDEPLPDTTPEGAMNGATFAYSVDRFTTPAWAHKAVFYHVFVDRFYPGNGRAWLQTSDLNGFCGGTLWGVAEKIDYIADLGATCVWLSPTFVSSSHHGYDATDYMRTEERLGGDAALRAVVQAAHDKGLRVLLDLACNHISDQHPIFQDALKNPASPYRDWFTFDHSPVGYRTFFGVASMPQVNTETEAARHWLFDIARYWLREFDIDGYRLDYVNGPGPSFWGEFRAACRAVKPDAVCIGEVIDAPNVQRTYIGQLDGCLDFHTAEVLRKAYGWGTLSEVELSSFLNQHRRYFDPDFVMPTFIDNHDMDRFLVIARGDKTALKRVVETQMGLVSPPIIYYGTEVGLSQATSTRDGGGLHINRTLMPWGEQQDRDLLEHYRTLIAARHAKGLSSC